MSGTQPYEFSQARNADREASARQRAAEQFIVDKAREFAAARRAYRVALASEILRLKADGMAITACGTVARGEPSIASLKYHEDVAEGMKEAASQAAWRASKDRDAELRFIEWSMRRDIAEGYQPPQGEGQTFGGRRAA